MVERRYEATAKELSTFANFR